MLLNLPDVPLRSTTFALEDRWLLWARVQVYPDRVELRGWSLTGRHHRHISLSQIEGTDHEDRRLLIRLRDGERVALIVDKPVRWVRFIRAHCDVHNDRRDP